MSDLASFVAAILRDTVVDELQKEVTELRRKVQANQADVEITGPGGFPTCAAFDLKEDGNSIYCLQSTAKICYAQDLLNVEIHIRGVGKVTSFKFKDLLVDTETYTISSTFDDRIELHGYEADNGCMPTIVGIRIHISSTSRKQENMIQRLVDRPADNLDDFASFDWRNAKESIKIPARNVNDITYFDVEETQSRRPPFCAVIFEELELSTQANKEISKRHQVS
jgi:hypothetical protein